MFQAKRAHEMPPEAPQWWSPSGLKLKIAKTRKMLLFLREISVFRLPRGLKWAANWPEVAYKISFRERVRRNLAQEGFKKA